MLQKIIITLGIVISLGLIWGALSINPEQGTTTANSGSVVREENGVQYIKILARGGYSPKQINAKANMPTVLEIETKGTYDCSASLTIPQLNYQKFLDPTGLVKIDVPKDEAKGPLNILCSMGMYSSTINFGT
jgi:plastocyanin domain-containing protein